MITAKTAPVSAAPMPTGKDDYPVWLFRLNARHARYMLDDIICEKLCRCETCQMVESGSNDPRSCSEHYRISEIIREIVDDHYITKESI